MEQKTKTGSCLCGAVEITISEPIKKDVSACHCGMCRKWTAGTFYSIHGGKEADIQFKGAESIGRYRSSDWAERAFCKECGSSLFYHSFEDDQCYVSADLFSEMDEFVLTSEIFYNCRPGYLASSGETEKVTEAEMFAQVSSNNQEK